MFRILLAIVCLLTTAQAQAGEVQDVLSLWGSQGGPWTGHIEIYGPDSSKVQELGLSTKWDAVPDRSIVTKIETFSGPAAETSAVTLMFADSETGDIVSPYFVAGKKRDYYFAVTSVSVTDATHWTTVIATPGGQEVYEGRPASLRYVRTRRGNVIENTKEVKFLDADDGAEYQLRSLIRQTLSP